MTRAAPEWLAEFQRRFGDAIRTPLDRSTGTLRATTNAYDPELVRSTAPGPATSREERLAVYNRQYWFRLFGVFHDAFPLTMRLLGAWDFNAYVAEFLAEAAPRHWDIAHASDGFVIFFEGAVVDRDDSLALVEAARIDRAWQDVFLAPPVEPFRPTEEHAARLLDARLAPSPAVAIVDEHAPLLELRHRIMSEPGESRVAAPSPHPSARSWAIVRRDTGTLQMPLDAREAELLRALVKNTVRDALALVEASCSDEERAKLPENARAWLAKSVANGFWIGLDQSQTTQL